MPLALSNHRILKVPSPNVLVREALDALAEVDRLHMTYDLTDRIDPEEEGNRYYTFDGAGDMQRDQQDESPCEERVEFARQTPGCEIRQEGEGAELEHAAERDRAARAGMKCVPGCARCARLPDRDRPGYHRSQWLPAPHSVQVSVPAGSVSDLPVFALPWVGFHGAAVVPMPGDSDCHCVVFPGFVRYVPRHCAPCRVRRPALSSSMPIE